MSRNAEGFGLIARLRSRLGLALVAAGALGLLAAACSTGDAPTAD